MAITRTGREGEMLEFDVLERNAKYGFQDPPR
jgi:hypothetical protein